MAQEVCWQIEGKVAYIRYWEDLTLADVTAAGETLLHWMDNSPQPLQMIFDVQELVNILPKLNDLATRPGSIEFYRHPNLGWIVYIGAQNNPLHQFIASALAQNHQAKMRWFYNEIEALAFLLEIDSSLSNNPENLAS